jgi:hypothetical protein
MTNVLIRCNLIKAERVFALPLLCLVCPLHIIPIIKKLAISGTLCSTEILGETHRNVGIKLTNRQTMLTNRQTTRGRLSTKDRKDHQSMMDRKGRLSMKDLRGRLSKTGRSDRQSKMDLRGRLSSHQSSVVPDEVRHDRMAFLEPRRAELMQVVDFALLTAAFFPSLAH